MHIVDIIQIDLWRLVNLCNHGNVYYSPVTSSSLVSGGRDENIFPGDNAVGLLGCFQNDCGNARNRIGNGSTMNKYTNVSTMYIFADYN